MPDGHCRHCADECGRWPWNNMNRDHFEKGEAATWDRDCCPACAEAERIEATRAEAYAEGAAAEREGIVDWLLRSADPGVRALADDVARLVP